MRVHVTTLRVNGQPVSSDDADRPTTLGELTIESESDSALGTPVTVARLRGQSVDPKELLAPLIDAKLTELSDDTFALTGVEVRGASRFAQAWYCKVDLWKPVVPDIGDTLDRGQAGDVQSERGEAHVLLGSDSR
jgi:hypothetical protein